MNPTGNIIGLLYKQTYDPTVVNEDWFVKCVDYIWRTLEQEQAPDGYHEALQWMGFLTHTPERERAIPYLAKLDAWLSQPGVIELDVHAAGYVQKVLDYAPTPDSYARKFISEDGADASGCADRRAASGRRLADQLADSQPGRGMGMARHPHCRSLKDFACIRQTVT